MDLDPKAVVAIVAMLSGASVCWSLAFAWAKWLGRPNPHGLPADPDSHGHDRLGAIEHAIEAVAIEVERIGERQRFANRLPGERPAADALGSRGAGEPLRVNTPH